MADESEDGTRPTLTEGLEAALRRKMFELIVGGKEDKAPATKSTRRKSTSYAFDRMERARVDEEMKRHFAEAPKVLEELIEKFPPDHQTPERVFAMLVRALRTAVTKDGMEVSNSASNWMFNLQGLVLMLRMAFNRSAESVEVPSEDVICRQCVKNAPATPGCDCVVCETRRKQGDSGGTPSDGGYL